MCSPLLLAHFTQIRTYLLPATLQVSTRITHSEKSPPQPPHSRLQPLPHLTAPSPLGTLYFPFPIAPVTGYSAMWLVSHLSHWLEWAPPGQGFLSIFFAVYPHDLEHCLAQSSCSINICWINEFAFCLKKKRKSPFPCFIVLNRIKIHDFIYMLKTWPVGLLAIIRELYFGYIWDLSPQSMFFKLQKFFCLHSAIKCK